MGKIIVVGSSTTDLVASSPALPSTGETVIGSAFNVFPGGKGANQAVAGARAGGHVSFVAKIGNDDYGRKNIERFKKDHIDTEKIILDPEHPSGIAVIFIDTSSGQNSIVMVPGSNGYLSTNDIKNIEKEIQEADVLLAQLEIPLTVVEFSFRLAKKYRVKTILNPAPAQPLSDDLLSFVDIITPNETETQKLIGIYPGDRNSMKKAASQLLAKVNDTAIITLGSQGVYYASKNGKEGIIPSVTVDAVDSTGAGDVFNGYLAAFLADGKSLEEAIQLSNKAAAISVTRMGAQPSIPKIDELGRN